MIREREDVVQRKMEKEIAEESVSKKKSEEEEEEEAEHYKTATRSTGVLKLEQKKGFLSNSENLRTKSCLKL